jgi:hypothetical protein
MTCATVANLDINVSQQGILQLHFQFKKVCTSITVCVEIFADHHCRYTTESEATSRGASTLSDRTAPQHAISYTLLKPTRFGICGSRHSSQSPNGTIVAQLLFVGKVAYQLRGISTQLVPIRQAFTLCLKSHVGRFHKVTRNAQHCSCQNMPCCGFVLPLAALQLRFNHDSTMATNLKHLLRATDLSPGCASGWPHSPAGSLHGVARGSSLLAHRAAHRPWTEHQHRAEPSSSRPCDERDPGRCRRRHRPSPLSPRICARANAKHHRCSCQEIRQAMTKDGSKALPVGDARLRANLVLESPACLAC